ncbi:MULTISPECIES: hypothetical protein [unclassified Streptomyces]|uniref:MarR family winged helix-turn-helix transcriptional regulator n=1 Tax=unclassified Streptomyces TaxID=2593676 RepID=UPI0033A937C3
MFAISSALPVRRSRTVLFMMRSFIFFMTGLLEMAAVMSVSILETAGLLRRVPSPGDEHAVAAVITDAGRELLERVLPGHVAVVQEGMFDALDDRQAEALSDALGAVRDRLRQLAPSPAERRRGRN